MHWGTSLFAILFAFSFLTFSYGQEVKDPPDPEVQKEPDKKEDKKPKDDKTPMPEPVAKFKPGVNFSGKLTAVSPNGELSIQVTQKVQTLKPNANQILFDYNRRKTELQFAIARTNNPFTKQQRILDLNRHLAKPPNVYDIKDVTHDVALKQAKDIKVRLAFPELQYDAKGQPIKMTPDKLKELQGPEGYPGFPAELSSLQPNTMVHVYLSKPQTQDPKKKGPDISDIVGGGGTSPIIEDDPNRPQIVLIVILNNYVK